MVINHHQQQSRFHTTGTTREAEGEFHLERKGLPRPQKASKELQGNRSNWNTSVKWKRKLETQSPTESIKAHFEQARPHNCASGLHTLFSAWYRNTQCIPTFDLCSITLKLLPSVHSTAKISPASSNPFKWWGISADLLYLGIKPAMQKQKGEKNEFSLI